ncbi:MAG: cobyric acid synthase [Pseudomonadota bacterium]
MTARALMLQGTGSDVGKSVLTAALVRIARHRGLSVAPFKPQNMSNNAAACPDGGEIGRAQAMQAQAAGLAPRVDFNPVLLKPQTDKTAQVVVHGRAASTQAAADYIGSRGALLQPVMESFQRLVNEFELVVIEGAGSPAEINLRAGDIANMGFARAANVPVCLIADIEKGGVIASLVGTQAVLSAADAEMIQGFIVNKFRGDPTLFDAGVDAIVAHTGWSSYGVVPWLPATARLPAEDAVSLEPSGAAPGAELRIAAPLLSRMANFDDADPLRQQAGVRFDWVAPGQPIPRDTDVIILFGTKSTLGDLAFLRKHGWDHDIHAHVRHGGHVLGICGGYQMLGRTIHDPDGIDGSAGSAPGLGLLDIETTMAADKTVRPVSGTCAIDDTAVSGYEIHAGRTTGPDCTRPLFIIGDKHDGAMSLDGRIAGTYLHGMFTRDAFRSAWYRRMGASHLQHYDYTVAVDQALDELAEHVAAALDIDALLNAARRPTFSSSAP